MQSNNTWLSGARESARRRESGSAVIETALVAIFVLIPILLGAIDFGRAFYVSIEVSNAARTAVQYASQSEAQLQDTANVVLVAKSEAPDVQGICTATTNACWVSGYPTASWGCECSNQSSAAGGTANSTSCVCPGHMVLYSLVTTQVTYTPMFPLFHMFPAITLHSQAKTRYALQ